MAKQTSVRKCRHVAKASFQIITNLFHERSKKTKSDQIPLPLMIFNVVSQFLHKLHNYVIIASKVVHKKMKHTLFERNAVWGSTLSRKSIYYVLLEFWNCFSGDTILGISNFNFERVKINPVCKLEHSRAI